MSDDAYHLEMEEPGCMHCDAGAKWIVCNRLGGDPLGTIYDNRDAAHEVCEAMNEAHSAGMAEAFKIVGRRAGSENRRQTDIAKPPEGVEERRRNGKNACDGRRHGDDGIPF